MERPRNLCNSSSCRNHRACGLSGTVFIGGVMIPFAILEEYLRRKHDLCHRCKGEGVVLRSIGANGRSFEIICPECDGTGYDYEDPTV